MRRLIGLSFLPAILAALPVIAPAQWHSVHRDATNNRHVPITSPISDISGAPALDHASAGFMSGGQVLLFEDKIVGVVRPTSPDRVSVKAINATTGATAWESADLDASAATFSLSAPVVDAVERSVYFGTGVTVYRLDADTGAVVWDEPLTAVNTDPSPTGRYAISNASPALTDDHVIVHTYDGGFSSPWNKTQLVALDRATGAVAWWQKAGGIGTTGPLIFENGGSPLVVAVVEVNGGGGLEARSAATGDLVWSSATVGTPWNTTNFIWTDPVLAGGKIYAVSYNFAGTAGELVKVDAATGELEFKVPSITADCPPVIVGGNAYLIGGNFSSPSVASYSTTTGASVYTASVPGTVFRNYLTATDNALFVAMSGQGVRVLDITNGSILSATQDTTMDGPVAIDGTGRIYSVNSAGALKAYDQTSSAVSEWLAY